MSDLLPPHKFFKYHPVTGSALEIVSPDLLKAADSDFPVHVKHSLSAVVVLINPEGQILLTRRGIDPYKGTWDLPGGFLSLDDLTIEDTAKREINEELGLEIQELNYLCSAAAVYPYKGLLEPIMTVAFSARVEDADVTIGDDVDAAKWYSLPEIEELEIGFAKVRKIISVYQETHG